MQGVGGVVVRACKELGGGMRVQGVEGGGGV